MDLDRVVLFPVSYPASHDWAAQCLTREQCLPWNEGIEFNINHFSIYQEIRKTKHLFPTKNALKEKFPQAYSLALLLPLHSFIF